MRLVAFVLLVAAVFQSAWGYETETHALMTNQAYTQSVLNPSNAGSVLHNLGLDRLDPTTPFRVYWGAPLNAGPDEYVDNLNAHSLLPPDEFERCNMQEFFDSSVPPNFAALFAPTVETPNSSTALLPIRNWLVRGAIREDDLGVFTAMYFGSRCGLLDFSVSTGSTVRVFNHFYDPIFDRGMSPCPLGLGPCQKSIDWAQGVVDSFPIPPANPVIDTSRRNHFSYEDARQAEWLALTEEYNGGTASSPLSGDRYNAAADRLYQWATVFRSLGDVVHLLQDTAQPQHVRIDLHSVAQSPEDQALEGFTNARVLGQSVGSIGGDGGVFVREFFGANLSAVVPPPPLGTYPAPTFATPLRFYTTRAAGDTSLTLPDGRYGMADYANRGFFTGGTLPGVSANGFLEPIQTVSSANGYTSVPVPCALGTPSIRNKIQAVTCAHYTHAVSDSVDAGYSGDVLPAGFTQPPIIEDGVFAKFINSWAPGTNYVSEQAIGPEELVTIGNLTIPRAIGYSTGMMNYFFRGTIDVETSSTAVLGVLNQGVTHTMNLFGYPCVGGTGSDGCAIFGFTALRISLHNATPALSEGIPGGAIGSPIPQTMAATATGDPRNPSFTGPYLVAVARYHRNECYTPQLGGMPVKTYAGTITNPSPTCVGLSIRTPYQEISVSNSLAVSAGTLNGTTATEELFDFSTDPIPVNATDLIIQIVYRGPLGSEQDGIAVGTLDIPEPSFVAFWNNTDYFLNSAAQWTPPTSSPNIRLPLTAMEVCAGGKKVYQFTSTGAGDVIAYPGTSPDDNPGSVRIGILAYPFPSNPNHTVSVVGKGTVNVSQQPPDMSIALKPDVTQANVENLAGGLLSTPSATCTTTDPTVAACWRDDPIQKRRGLLWGLYWAPIYIDQSGGAVPPDVDAAPLPPWTTTTVTPEGTVLFNTPGTLSNCVL